MRSLAISAIALAFIGTVSAKWGFGRCDYEIKQMTFSEYEDIDPEVVAKPHIEGVAAYDKSLDRMIEFIEAWGFKIPLDPLCDNIGTVSPWKEIAEKQLEIANDEDPDQDYADGELFSFYDEDVFNQFYLERKDAIVRMTNGISETTFVPTTNYVCIDIFSGPALVEYGRTFGLDTLDVSITLLEAVNSLLSVVQKLNLTFKLHALFLLGGVPSLGWTFGKTEKASLDPKIPDYKYVNELNLDLFAEAYLCPEED